MKHSLAFISVSVGAVLVLGIALPQGNARTLQYEENLAQLNTLLRGKRSANIIRGSEVVPHSLPYQAYVHVTTIDGGSPACGGSLISRKYVLTAAHCFDDAKSVEVVLGAHNVLTNEVTQIKLAAANYIVHEGWDPRAIVNDIALVELPSEVELTEAIGIIQIPTRQEAASSILGEKVRVSGWGLTNEGGASPVLLQAELTVIDNSVCKADYGINTDHQVCALNDNGIGACSGDSGGPLVELSINKQIGVVSYTMTGCLAGYPSGYAKVGDYLDWIEENSDVKIL